MTRGGKRENEVIGSKGSIWISPRRTAGITLLLMGVMGGASTLHSSQIWAQAHSGRVG